jgi:hypothetical protein
MQGPKKKPTAAKLRNWRVSILRNRAEFLGIVKAADAEAAEVVAAETFKLATAAGGLPCGLRNDLHPLSGHLLGLRGP